MICRGKVLLHLSEVILLDRCEVRVLKPVLRCYVCKVEVAQLLLDEGFGMKNQTAVSVMTEMAAKGGAGGRRAKTIVWGRGSMTVGATSTN